MNEAGRSRIAQAILDYLRKHPQAQDTLAGITEWWLPEQAIKSNTATVKEALDQLVLEGLLSEHRGKDAQVSYRITSQGLDLLEQTLTQQPE